MGVDKFGFGGRHRERGFPLRDAIAVFDDPRAPFLIGLRFVDKWCFYVAESRPVDFGKLAVAVNATRHETFHVIFNALDLFHDLTLEVILRIVLARVSPRGNAAGSDLVVAS